MSKDNLTHRQWRTMNALLVSKTLDEAALNAKVSRRTIERYLKNELFVREFECLARQSAMMTLGFRIADFQENTRVFREIRDNPDSPPNARIRAANYLEKSLFERLFFAKLIDRIETVEQISNELQHSG